MMTDEQSKVGYVNLRPLGYLAAAIFVVWCLAWLLLLLSFSGWPERGQFGDMFGSVNSLFSGLAFGGVIYTIFLQRQELALQRKELELTRTQLARAADAQEKSEKALTLQVETLQRTAHVNALSSLIEHYSIKISSTPIASEKLAAQRQQLVYVGELESQLRSFSAPETTGA